MRLMVPRTKSPSGTSRRTIHLGKKNVRPYPRSGGFLGRLQARRWRRALVLKESLGSEVHLFNLAAPGGNDEFLAGVGGTSVAPNEMVEDARAHLRRYVENLFPGQAAGVAFHAHFGTDVVRGIERAAKEIGATLVLLAGRPQQSVFRTHIERITRDLDGSVMVLWTEREGSPS